VNHIGVVLSIHSIFAGVTLGLATPGASYSFDAFIALLLHKLFEAIALGVTVSRDAISGTVIANVVVYALCSPLGILLGALLASYSDNGNRVFSEALIVSITSGSFLYM
jgi:zinc transporter ZupT